ncbi:MAG: MBL fold metallo-hydrolase [Gemmatimonadaceae bacterium]
MLAGRFAIAAVAAALLGASLKLVGRNPFAAKLHIEEVGSDSTAFDVVSVLVAGPTEAILWDAQYHVAEAKQMADKIAASGKHLKAIIISHPDHDHFSGLVTILQRFPGTPVYMTARGLAVYDTTAERGFKNEKSRRPATLPDSLARPQPLPTTHFKIDGEDIEIIPDLQGDVITPTNSIMWIPSLNTVLAGDVIFNGVHPWLGSSDVASRAAWRSTIQRMIALHPTTVVAGHKKDVNAPDSFDAATTMDNYLKDFDALRATSSSPEELRNAMLAKYPDMAVRGLLGFGAQMAFKK